MSSSTLKQLGVYLVALLVGFVVLDRLAGMGFARLIEASNLRFSRAYAGAESADLLIVGNSRAVNAFYAPYIEKEHGIDVFNLAYNGMSVEIVEALLMDYLERNEKPRMVLFEVTNLHVKNDLLLDLKLYQSFSDRLSQLIRSNEPKLAGACAASHVYRYNCEMFLRALFYLAESDQGWINSGIINKQYASQYCPSDADQSANMLTTVGANWDALMRIVDLCEASQIELGLVVTPYLQNHILNLEAYPEWLEAFESQLPESVEFYDLSSALDGTAGFADPLHINRKGGEELFEIMLELGVLGELKNEL